MGVREVMESRVFCPRYINLVIIGDNAQSSTSNGKGGNQRITNFANFVGNKKWHESLF